MPVGQRKRAERGDWRRVMLGELAWILVAKAAALVLLWFLFFSPAHRQQVDGDATGRRFAVDRAEDAPRTQSPLPYKEKSRD